MIPAQVARDKFNEKYAMAVVADVKHLVNRRTLVTLCDRDKRARVLAPGGMPHSDVCPLCERKARELMRVSAKRAAKGLQMKFAFGEVT